MVTNKERTHTKLFWPWWRWLLTGLNTLALVLSVILSWHYLSGGSMAGCGGGSPCDQVLNSRWSMLAGVVPVSGMAVGAYLAMLVASFFIGPYTEVSIRRLAWSAMLILSGAVAGGAIWFTILQKWVIGAFCPYCMTTHLTGFLLAALVVWRAIKQTDKYNGDIPVTDQTKVQNITSVNPRRNNRLSSVLSPALIGLLLAAILAAFQAGVTPSTIYRKGESHNDLPRIDYHSVPMVGSADAPYIVTLLFDYQCSHCQKIHFMLEEAINHYAGKLAFVLCPAPLNTQCNPYVHGDVDAFKNSCELAKISLAVWYAKHDAFPAFENWMYTFESGSIWHPRSPESARTKAAELVGHEKFDAALGNPWIGQYIQDCVQTYGKTVQNGQGGVPKLIFGSRWVIPEPYNADELIVILQNSLAVPRP